MGQARSRSSNFLNPETCSSNDGVDGQVSSTATLLVCTPLGPFNMSDQFLVANGEFWGSVAQESNEWKEQSKKKNRRKRMGKSVQPNPGIAWLETYKPVVEETVEFEPYMLFLMGLPGSGKTTIATKIQEILPWKFIRINQDELGSKYVCLEAAERAIRDGKCPIIDRCNVSNAQRRRFLELASTLACPMDLVVLDVPPQECIRRCKDRRGHETLKPVQVDRVVSLMSNEWKIPNKSEGFREQTIVKDNQQLQNLLESIIPG